jgi:hypothetical protein
MFPTCFGSRNKSRAAVITRGRAAPQCTAPGPNRSATRLTCLTLRKCTASD